MTARPSADELNEAGRSLAAEGRDEEAIFAYRAATEIDPGWSVPWFNLGLVHKYRGDWESSAACNRRAVDLDDSDEGAWWNLGIASSALGRWADAREAWNRCGIVIPAGEGPVDAHYGLTPIRLDPGGRGEVVWCDRIDPARAIIRNVPLPESGYLWGDLVLHDGAPNGVRVRAGREVPVFDALELLQRSAHRTYILDLPDSTAEDRAALGDVAFDLGGAAEDWSRSISFLCRSCSEGKPHEKHDDALASERPDLAVAAAAEDDEHLDRIIAAWRSRTGYAGYVGRTLAAGAPE